MNDKNGKPLQKGDKVILEANGGSLVFEDCTVHSILKAKDGREVAMIRYERNILGNLFPSGSNQITKIENEERIDAGSDESPRGNGI